VNPRLLSTAHAVLMLLTSFTLIGCQTSGQTKQLADSNKRLEIALADARSEITALKTREQTLSRDLDQTKQVLGVMGQEKQSRVEESSSLRQQTRQFLLAHIDKLRQFLLEANLHDYIGGDLIGRKQAEGDSQLLVDFGHPLPRNGQLAGASVHANKACKFAVRVLRKIDDELIVVWEGPVFDIKQAGIQRSLFPVAVGVERGDFAAFWFPGEVCVGHDKGTGDFRFRGADMRIGNSTTSSSFDGARDKRMYSLGVFGLLN